MGGTHCPIKHLKFTMKYKKKKKYCTTSAAMIIAGIE
jgi:hypothetical protein